MEELRRYLAKDPCFNLPRTKRRRRRQPGIVIPNLLPRALLLDARPLRRPSRRLLLLRSFQLLKRVKEALNRIQFVPPQNPRYRKEEEDLVTGEDLGLEEGRKYDVVVVVSASGLPIRHG